MRPLARPAISAVKKAKIKFYPPRWTKVYLNWMENIQDWCISRQIWWGTAYPFIIAGHAQAKNPDKGIIVSKENPKDVPNALPPT